MVEAGLKRVMISICRYIRVIYSDTSEDAGDSLRQIIPFKCNIELDQSYEDRCNFNKTQYAHVMNMPIYPNNISSNSYYKFYDMVQPLLSNIHRTAKPQISLL